MDMIDLDNIQDDNISDENLDDLIKIYNVQDDDLIVDIGGNDGTLLNAFKDCKKIVWDVLNIDPSENLAKLAESKGIPTICDFFSFEVSEKVGRKAKVVVSTNVFQHLKDINSFTKGVHNLLDKDSIWVLEFPYWIHD